RSEERAAVADLEPFWRLVAAQRPRCGRVRRPAQRTIELAFGKENDGIVVVENVAHATEPRMAVLDGRPEWQIALIGGRGRARHDRKNLLVRRGAAVAMLAAACKKTEACDVRAVAAIILRQSQREAVHQRIAGQRIERPLRGRNAGRKTETPA